MKPYLLNIGLPRTGTTSFTEAIRLMGKTCQDIWPQAEHHEEVLHSFIQGHPAEHTYISSYDALSDTPFYVLRKVFEEQFPKTTIVCTKRPQHEWIQSMLNHQTAGGQFFARYYKVADYPYTSKSIESLKQAFDYHYEFICKDIPVIDLRATDDKSKWNIICSAFPESDRLSDLYSNFSWPMQNAFDVSSE